MPSRIGDFLIREDFVIRQGDPSIIKRRARKSEVAAAVASAHPVICDAAYETFRSTTPREFKIENAGGTIMPWDWTWMEWKTTLGPIGWLIHSEQNPITENRHTYASLFMLMASRMRRPDETGVVVEMVTDAQGDQLPQAFYRDRWSEWSTPGEDGSFDTFTVYAPDWISDESLERTGPAIQGLWAAALFVIRLLNCKNVTTRELPLGKKRLAEVEKNQRLRFSTIETRQRNGDRCGTESDPRQPPAVHICRGHFKDYRESGIFGKNHGVYWWQPHARGNLDRGYVASKHVV